MCIRDSYNAVGSDYVGFGVGLAFVVFLLVLRLVGLVNIIDSFIPRPLQVELGKQGWE